MYPTIHDHPNYTNTKLTTMHKKTSQLIDDISQYNTTCNYLDHLFADCKKMLTSLPTFECILPV